MNLTYNHEEVSKNGQYRIGVGAVIEKNGLIFCAHRLDAKELQAVNFLQLPQGGVDKNEEIGAAIFREIFEETGIDSKLLQFVARAQNWTYYDVPTNFGEKIGGKKGQAHIWFHFRFIGEDSDVNLNAFEPEFSAFFWKPAAEIVENSIHFKKEVHRLIFREFGLV